MNSYTAKVNSYRKLIEIHGLSCGLMVTLKQAKKIHSDLGEAIKQFPNDTLQEGTE